MWGFEGKFLLSGLLREVLLMQRLPVTLRSVTGGTR